MEASLKINKKYICVFMKYNPRGMFSSRITSDPCGGLVVESSGLLTRRSEIWLSLPLWILDALPAKMDHTLIHLQLLTNCIWWTRRVLALKSGARFLDPAKVNYHQQGQLRVEAVLQDTLTERGCYILMSRNIYTDRLPQQHPQAFWNIHY